MKKIFLILAGMVVLSGCSAELQASVIFDEAWDDVVNEYFWARKDVTAQEEAMVTFSAWSDEYENKRAKLIRRDEDGVLQGITVILGQNIERNIVQMEEALEEAQMIDVYLEQNRWLLLQICAAQKTRVDCGL